jgi:hypothetical protein
MPIQQRTDARRLAGEVPPMAIACVLRPYSAFRAAAQRAHDFIIGWMSHSIPPALASHTTPRPALPHLASLGPPSLGPARRSAPQYRRRLRAFSITILNSARNAVASATSNVGPAPTASSRFALNRKNPNLGNQAGARGLPRPGDRRPGRHRVISPPVWRQRGGPPNVASAPR